MRATLFDHIPSPPPPPPKPKLRQRRRECGLYIRWPGKGRKVQLRWWLGGHGSINCGLYHDEETAVLVRKEVLREVANHPLTPLGIWRALQIVFVGLRERFPGARWPVVQPMYVVPAKRGYAVKFHKGGRKLELAGPFKTPEKAHAAALDLVAREFPRPVVRDGVLLRRSLWDCLVA